MKNIKAVLFDMDGLMIDSEPLHLQAFNSVLAKQENTKRLIKNNIVEQPGLIALMRNLYKNGYKIAIASSSRLETIEIVVRGLKLSSLIDSLASADEVEHGKPAPDVYLLAAKKLGVKPEECLVLEDAPKGVEAGKRAGMLVFAIPSNETRGGDFSLADKVLNSLSEVFSLL